MIKKLNIENIPDENWFYEADKKVEELYVSNLTCDNVINPLSNPHSFEHFKCTYCERADNCYKGSLDFKDLITKEHLNILNKISEQQISDIIFDLKRTSFVCPECNEFDDELDKDECESCNGLELNGFHQFISKMKSVKQFELIKKFINVEKIY